MARRRRQDPPQERRWYVYALIDPRDGWPFYVGKGSGRRAWQHAAAVARGVDSNPWKAGRIRAILAAGLRPQVQILSRFTDEAMAYRCERATIRAFGRLTNINPGGCPQESTRDRLRRWADDRLKHVMPFDVWMSAYARTALAEEYYWRVVAELQLIATHGWLDRARRTRRAPA